MADLPLKILVADDSSVIHELFRNALGECGLHEIVHAFDGTDCEKALDRGVDLAFIDVQMPKMSGMEALWAARSRGNKTFVTLISGLTEKKCVDLARQLDAYELLLKPFKHDDVHAIVTTYRRISAPMRALVVDDSRTVRKIIQKVLTDSIFRLQIEEAGEGAAALVRCQDAHFDVVFLDCNMPGLNGMQTLARLRKQNPEIKVVMMSSEHNITREREALKLGAAAYLHKPFYPGEIDALLHQAFGLRSPKFATDGCIRDFGIKIHGRTIAIEHQTSGHVYQFIWFRDPPYLRLPAVKNNPDAEITPAQIRAEAERAAVLELKNASLLSDLVY